MSDKLNRLLIVISIILYGIPIGMLVIAGSIALYKASCKIILSAISYLGN